MENEQVEHGVKNRNFMPLIASAMIFVAVGLVFVIGIVIGKYISSSSTVENKKAEQEKTVEIEPTPDNINDSQNNTLENNENTENISVYTKKCTNEALGIEIYIQETDSCKSTDYQQPADSRTQWVGEIVVTTSDNLNLTITNADGALFCDSANPGVACNNLDLNFPEYSLKKETATLNGEFGSENVLGMINKNGEYHSWILGFRPGANAVSHSQLSDADIVLIKEILTTLKFLN